MKVVVLRQALVGSGSPQEADILFRVVLAEGKLVDLFLAAQKVRIALEEALLQVVEDGKADWFDLHSTFHSVYALEL